MADAILINGFENQQQFSSGGYEGYPAADLSPTAEQVEYVLNSDSFREGLQNMVEQQMKIERLPYGARVFGPVTPIGDIHGADTLNYTKDEKVLRGKLASCYRLADIHGWSHGLDGYITVRVVSDNGILIAPHSVMYDEVTASNLVKVDLDGRLIDSGSTTLGVDAASVALHSAVYSAKVDINCVVHVASPAVVSVSTMKCGLLPLCHEAMTLGEIAYAEYSGLANDTAGIRQALGSGAKVIFLRNFGVVVAGETIEEAFLTILNVMTAVDTQLNLVPFGLSSLHLPSDESRKEAFRAARETPLGVSSVRRLGYGEVEFEAFMRQLDNAGYRTGHVYRDTVTNQRRTRASSEADVAGRRSVTDSKEFPNISVQRKGSRAEWVVSPNVYHREESERPNSSLKVTRWISEVSDDQWVSETGRPRTTTPSRLVQANKFAPQGDNPNELRNKVKEIRKEYFEDTITAGPQSTVLEGVTWEEAQRIKQGQMIGGIDNVFVTAASRGIIQRQHQRSALFYKNFSQTNPFDKVTKDDLDAYKHEVERKSKRRAGGFMSADELDEPSYPDNRPFSAPPPQLSFSIARPTETSPSYLRDTDDEVFKSTKVQVSEVAAVESIPKTQPKPMPVPVETHEETVESKRPADIQAVVTQPAAEDKSKTVEQQPASDVNLQRTHSARYSPDKRPDPGEFKRNVKKSKSLRLPFRNKHDTEALQSPESQGPSTSKEDSPSREVSEGGTLPKDKKKKRGFRLPSFSKKKDKQ